MQNSIKMLKKKSARKKQNGRENIRMLEILTMMVNSQVKEGHERLKETREKNIKLK